MHCAPHHDDVIELNTMAHRAESLSACHSLILGYLRTNFAYETD